jgi:hypothetical protein
MVILDATVTNVALPPTGRGLHGGVTGLQWVVDAYTLAFAALLLNGGALAERLGGRRVFAFGLAVFGAASAACGSRRRSASWSRRGPSRARARPCSCRRHCCCSRWLAREPG